MLKKKGQNTAEFAILIALVIAGAIAMQTYVKRGFQGGVKYAVDKLKSKAPNAAGQYEPYYLETSYQTTQSDYTDTEETLEHGQISRNIADRTTSRAGYQRLKAPSTQNGETVH